MSFLETSSVKSLHFSFISYFSAKNNKIAELSWVKFKTPVDIVKFYVEINSHETCS